MLNMSFPCHLINSYNPSVYSKKRFKYSLFILHSVAVTQLRL